MNGSYREQGRIISVDILTAASALWTSPTIAGNSDGGYRLRGRVINATAQSNDLTFLIGGVGSNLVIERLYYTGAAVASDTNISGLSASGWADFDLVMADARSGNGPRLMQGWITNYTAAAIAYQSHLTWLLKTVDNNVEITSFQLACQRANGMGIGSKFVLERTF